MALEFRYQCYVADCDFTVKKTTRAFSRKDVAELSRHFHKKGDHQVIGWDHDKACGYNKSLLEEHYDSLLDMDTLSESLPGGRPQREKKPTEKVKVATKPTIADKEYVLPPRYLPNNPEDPKWTAKPKEIPKIYDHTKTSKITGEKTEFYKLGNQ